MKTAHTTELVIPATDHESRTRCTAVAAKTRSVLATCTNPDVTQAVARLDDDERAMFNIGRQGDSSIVSEPGLYSLILGSRKLEELQEATNAKT